ncbi:ATP-binding protein [Metallosphaera hakonensis]|uniref:ATP-binding protein n=1 Tax=Metallosphaera hakonensis TaxID=79601 RepID=UPI001F109D16|nr:ATP-binding protein [Metallosphaera hakonensis]
MEVDKGGANFQKELESLMETLSRRDVGFEYYVLTSLSKRKAISTLIVIKECSNCRDLVLEEIENIKNIANAVSPHIHLETVSSSERSLPVPGTWGNLSYAKIFEKIIDSPKNTFLPNNFDIEIGYMKTDVLELKTGIRSSDITRHIGIFGTTGSGKSTTATTLIKSLLEKGIYVTILDWHGEHVNKISRLTLLNSENLIKINPFKLGDIEEIVEILGDVLQLTDPQRFLLYSILIKMRRANRFDMKMFSSLLRNIDETTGWIREVKYGLLRKAYLLFTREARQLFDDNNDKDKFDVEKLLFNTIIDLSFIRNLRLRKIYGMLIIKILSDYFMKNRPLKTLLLVVEEAHNYFEKDNDFLEKLISEVRKFGLGLCIISQSPSSITEEVLKNTNIKIIHTIKSDVDKRILAESLSLSPSLYEILDKLDVGEALLSAPNIKIPIIIKIKGNP